MKYKLLRLSLLSVLCVLFGGGIYAITNALMDAQQAEPEVTLDFTEKANWPTIPTSGNANKDLTSFTNSDESYTIKLYATNNYKMNDGYLILGKKDSYLELPAFDFDVEKIEVTGTSGASTAVEQNIYVGDVAVSTKTTGAKDVTNTYEIASDYQAAGNIYKLVVTSAHNTQISKILVYKKASGGTTDNRTETTVTFADGYATSGAVGDVLDLPVVTISAGGTPIDAVPTWESDNEGVANIANGKLNLMTKGTAKITASFAGDNDLKPSSKSYTVTVYNKYTTIAGMLEDITSTKTMASYQFENLLVTYVQGSYTFVSDGQNGFLFYGSDLGLTAGSTYAGTATGQLYAYSGLPEMALSANGISAQATSEGNLIAWTAITPDALANNINVPVTIENAVYVSASDKNLTFKVGETEFTARNNWNIDVTALEANKTYTLKGIGSVFNTTYQLYLVSFEEKEDEPTEPTFPITATWDFTDATVVAAVTALSGTTAPGTVAAVEDNGLLLTVEANGQTIRNNGNSIQTGNPVVFKVPVQGKKDVVKVVGFSSPYFAYSIAGVDATEATTTYTATAADVAQGYVEVVNKGQYLISISVTQNEDDTPVEPTFPITATWDFTDATVVAAVTALSGTTAPGTVAAVEDNGLLLTVEANGQTIRNNGNSIQTGNPVVFKVPVQGKKDVVKVVGFSSPYFAYSIAGVDATEATTTYTATAADVAQGYVEVVNKGQYLISISVTQNEDDSSDEPVDQDVTGTWNYGNETVMNETVALSGSNEAGEVNSVEKTLKMTVEANGATFRNNGNNIQVGSGAVFKIPVRNVGDLVTVKGYPKYASYTVGNVTVLSTQDGETPDATYKAKSSDVEQGYVAVTSNGNNNYYYSLSVVQYAPKQATTLEDEAATATFPFDQGTDGQKATFTNPAYWLNSKVTLGSNMSIYGIRTIDSKAFTGIQPKTDTKETAGEGDYVTFLIQPKFGFTFTPTKVSLNAAKYGTGNGTIDVLWQNTDGTHVELAKGQAVARNNATPAYSSFEFTNLSAATPGEGACGIRVNIYGKLAANKELCLRDIVIEGVLNGTEKDVPVLASFKINGDNYNVEDVFDGGYEAEIELSKTATMVGENNPLTDVTATSGEIGTITYEGSETQCTVTIPMTAGDVSLSYVLNVIQKPDYTLTYYNTDGEKMGTQQVEKDAAIGEFAVDYTTATAPEGEKVRGWFYKATGGQKATTADVITANTSLYAVATEIEVSSTTKKYTFNLTDPYFYAEDHEAFSPQEGAQCKFHDTTHGWAVYNGDKIDLLVGPKAIISIATCKYSHMDNILVKKGEETLAELQGMDADTDGKVVSYTYEGDPGTLTLEMVATGESYIHSVKIANVAETSFDKEGDWYFVKAGDADSFIDVLDVVNGANAATDAARAYIFLPNGTYDLKQTVKTSITGNNISVIGQSMEGVIIKNRPAKEGINETATLLNNGKDNYFQDLTIDCIAPWGGSAERGVCLQDGGNNTICKNVYLKGLQDTYVSNNANSTYYFENGKIEGSVDYVCGYGDVYFNKVLFYTVNKSTGAVGGCIAAPNTLKSFGYIFNECTLDGMANEDGKYRLARPWAANTIVRMLNTTMKIKPNAAGWGEWSPANAVTQFAEYNSVDADGNAVDVSGRATTIGGQPNNPVITAEEAATYTPETIFSGEWKPYELTVQVEAPAAELKDGTISWTPANNGAIAYAIFKNGQLLGITAESSFVVEAVAETGEAAPRRAEAADKYTIRAANARGGFGEAKEVKDAATGISTVKNGQQTDTIYNMQGVRVNNVQKGVYIVNGRKVVIK